jgi:hypothetical protein
VDVHEAFDLETHGRLAQDSLNNKSEPNWLTYSKLQELADRVTLELQNRGQKPRSGMDVQRFAQEKEPTNYNP